MEWKTPTIQKEFKITKIIKNPPINSVKPLNKFKKLKLNKYTKTKIYNIKNATNIK